MPESITLTVASQRGPEHAVHVTRQLASDLRRTGTIGVAVPEATGSSAEGTRGGEVLVQLALAMISAGGVTALMDAIKAYVARDKTIRLTLKTADGREISVDAKEPASVPAALEALISREQAAGGAPKADPGS
jgi:hypothetical protein